MFACKTMILLMVSLASAQGGGAGVGSANASQPPLGINAVSEEEKGGELARPASGDKRQLCGFRLLYYQPPFVSALLPTSEKGCCSLVDQWLSDVHIRLPRAQLRAAAWLSVANHQHHIHYIFTGLLATKSAAKNPNKVIS